MTYFVTTTPAEALSGNSIKDGDEDMFLHIFYALLLLIALYYLIMLLKNTILNFRRGHGLNTGPQTYIVIEFCNLQHGLLVHVAQVQTPIPLLTDT